MTDVVVRHKKEVTRAKDVQGKDIHVLHRVHLFALLSVPYLELISAILMKGCALDLHTEQSALVI